MASIGVSLAPVALVLVGCFPRPDTSVVVENDYSPASERVVYAAFWQAVSFSAPIQPGSSSPPVSTVAASENTAYVLLAPGWDPNDTETPKELIVLQSTAGFSVGFDDTLVIPVDDQTFTGNCASGSHLTQPDADFITQRVFQSQFAGLSYDAATCSLSAVADAAHD